MSKGEFNLMYTVFRFLQGDLPSFTVYNVPFFAQILEGEIRMHIIHR